MIPKNILCLITTIIWLGLLTACTPPANPAATATIPPVELAGTEWVLVLLNGRSPLPDTRLALTFNEGEVSGFSGCNWYGGTYTTGAEGSLTIPEIASTERDCPEIEGILAQESAFQKALWTADSYHLQDDRLEISNAAGDTILIFERKAQFDMDPADLVGTAWQLTVWDGRDLLPDTEITLVFDDAETMSGFAGCRHYNGRYTAQGDDIRFPMLSMVESNCNQAEAVLIQEGNFTTALSETSNYQLADGQLILYTDPGAVLRFAPLAETLETPTPHNPGNADTLSAPAPLATPLAAPPYESTLDEGIGQPLIVWEQTDESGVCRRARLYREWLEITACNSDEGVLYLLSADWQAELLQLSSDYTSFVADTAEGHIEFYAADGLTASPPEARLIAWWVARLVQETESGQTVDTTTPVLTWQRQQNEQCQRLHVTLTGTVTAFSCDTETAVELMQVRLTPENKASFSTSTTG